MCVDSVKELMFHKLGVTDWGFKFHYVFRDFTNPSLPAENKSRASQVILHLNSPSVNSPEELYWR